MNKIRQQLKVDYRSSVERSATIWTQMQTAGA